MTGQWNCRSERGSRMQKILAKFIGAVAVVVAGMVLLGAPVAAQAEGEAETTQGEFTRTGAVYVEELESGSSLYPGDKLFSKDGKYQLVMQGDGNLVIYKQSVSEGFWRWPANY